MWLCIAEEYIQWKIGKQITLHNQRFYNFTCSKICFLWLDIRDLAIEGGLSWYGLSLRIPWMLSRWNRMVQRNRFGRFLKWWYPQNTPKWSFLVRKPMVVGYHHFRKHPFVCVCVFFHHFCCGRNEGGFREPVWNPHILPWSLDCYCMEGAQTSSWCSMTLEMKIL